MKRLVEFLRKLDDIGPQVLIAIILVVQFFRGSIGFSDSRAFNSFAGFWGTVLLAVLAAGALRLILWPLRVLAEKLVNKPPQG